MVMFIKYRIQKPKRTSPSRSLINKCSLKKTKILTSGKFCKDFSNHKGSWCKNVTVLMWLNVMKSETIPDIKSLFYNFVTEDLYMMNL